MDDVTAVIRQIYNTLLFSIKSLGGLLISSTFEGVSEGGFPTMAYTGRLRLMGIPQVYEMLGKSVISASKKAQKGYYNRCILWLWKSRENVLILWSIHILKTAHLQPLKVMQSSKLGMLKGYLFFRKCYICIKGLVVGPRGGVSPHNTLLSTPLRLIRERGLFNLAELVISTPP